MAYQIKTYTMRSVVPLPRGKVWELLGDTDHLNRFIGLFALQATPPRGGAGGLYREMAAKVSGIVPVRWKEYPFEWERYQYYAVRREYSSGPLRMFYGGVRLRDAVSAADGASTEIELFAEFTPANLLAFIAIPMTGYRALIRTMQYVEEYIRLNAGSRNAERHPQLRSRRSIRSEPLERWLAELPDGQRRLAGMLAEHLAWCDDDGVVDMRPYVLARMWSEDKEDTLRLFLHATRSGILNLSWNLICPNCRVSKVRTSAMSQLEEQFHCDFCGIVYEANFDKYVELCFSVHRSVREAHKQTYCIGGPMITPHIAAQKALRPGQAVELAAPELLGKLRLRTLQTNRMLELPSGGGTFAYSGERWGEQRSGAAGTSASSGNITVRNDHNEPIVAVLETADWDVEAVTAAKVTTMHEFRSWFSSEVLAPGQQVGVESVTILFSDLLGSTAFYERVGDAPAYGQVRRHFDFMLKWIHANRGTLVKTIGDAVMAVFPEPRLGLQAALDIQRHVGEFNRANVSDTPIVIKMGLHHGPAIAVNSNGLLDYFGRTVNIAARIQAQSAGGDVVISAADPLVQALLDAPAVVTERFAAQLKGIDEDIGLLRLRPRPDMVASEAR